VIAHFSDKPSAGATVDLCAAACPASRGGRWGHQFWRAVSSGSNPEAIRSADQANETSKLGLTDGGTQRPVFSAGARPALHQSTVAAVRRVVYSSSGARRQSHSEFDSVQVSRLVRRKWTAIV